jgi:prepilin-type N-terminal cleavage/methylation domain-containing protein
MRGRLVQRLRGRAPDGGYTMVELLAVLAIFLTVVTALTTLFVSGSKAELDANNRFQAQQNARLALDRLRRELHCSSGITKTDGTALTTTPVAAIRVTLPSHCPTAGGVTSTVDYTVVSKGTSRWELRRTKGGTAIPIADYLIEDEIFTYTAASASTRALLHVDMPVNVNPNEGWKNWRLVDDIVLRNTLRVDP